MTQPTSLVFFRTLGGTVAVDPAWPCRQIAVCDSPREACAKGWGELRADEVPLGSVCDILLDGNWRMGCRITSAYLGKPIDEQIDEEEEGTCSEQPGV